MASKICKICAVRVGSEEELTSHMFDVHTRKPKTKTKRSVRTAESKKKVPNESDK